MSVFGKRLSLGVIILAALIALAGVGLSYWSSTISFDPAVDSGAGEVKRGLATMANWAFMAAGGLGVVGVGLRLTGR